MPIADVIEALDGWEERKAQYKVYRDYDNGIHKYTFASEAFLNKYKWILESARENLCPATIAGFTDALEIIGWEGAGGDKAGELYHRGGLRTVSNLAHREAFRTGDSYVLVWWDGNGDLVPWFHEAHEVTPLPDPLRPGTQRAYVKIWRDRKRYRASVYYADRMERFITRHDQGSAATRAMTKATAWQEFTEDGDGPVIQHPFGRPPWVRFARDAKAQGGYGRSILHDVIPLQDMLNKSIADLIVGSEQFAAPLRALMNYKPEVFLNQNTGQFEAKELSYDDTRQKIFGIEGDGPLVQLDPPDATQLLKVQDAAAGKIGRVIGLPPYFFMQWSGDIPSGESLRVLSQRRTSTLRDFQQDATDPWRDYMGLMGFEAQPVWRDASPESEREQLEAAVIRKALGYPLEVNLQKLGEDEPTRKDIHAQVLLESSTQGRAAREAWQRGETI